jgi:hypothetical protein
VLGAIRELEVLSHPVQYVCTFIALTATAISLWVSNSHRSRTAILYFEELPEEVITTLKLITPR